jgi:beta-glucosidase
MICTRTLLTALSCLAIAGAQNTPLDHGIPTVAEVIGTINATGLIPADVVELAATFLVGVANSTKAALDTVLADNPIPEKRDDPELYYAYGRSPAVYPSRMYVFPGLEDTFLTWCS